MKTYEDIADIGIVPVVTFENIKQAVPTAGALYHAGIRSIEVTLRTEAGLDAIRVIKEAYPELTVGAGTVIREEQVEAAVSSGAEFIISPGLQEAVVDRCREMDVTVIPGCVTPGEIERALKMGLKVIKFFPAEQAGGLKYLKALAGPYRDLKFFPTGGIHAGNIREYLKCPSVLCCGGSWMVSEQLLEEEDYEGIGKKAEETIKSIMSFRIRHVGINCNDSGEARDAAHAFCKVFDFEYRDTPASIFCEDSIEVLKNVYLGEKGHIAIGTAVPEKAVRYLERKEIRMNKESAVYRKDGLLQAVYLEKEIGGFAIHLVRV